MTPKPQNVWYFAYGSNMSLAKFTGSRGIVPFASARVLIPGWTLVMEIPGLPYSEPSYASICPRDHTEAESAHPYVIGIAYLITAEQYVQVIASEGGQIAYSDVSILGVPIALEDEHKIGPVATVRTLRSTSMVRHPPPRPSKRYMKLLANGAKEAQLPTSYQEYLTGLPCYTPQADSWVQLGASIFLGLINPVWSLLSRITHSNTGEDGNVPAHIVWLVRGVIFMIWFVHDWVFAPIFGRGDGLDQEQTEVMEEKNSMGFVCEKKSDGFYCVT